MEKIRQDKEHYEPFGEQNSSPKTAGKLESKILGFLGSLGKHAASEVVLAATLEECWQIV